MSNTRMHNLESEAHAINYNIQQAFFKTVRLDYTSVWAPMGSLGKKYEIGGHYIFPEEHPAFVWLPSMTCKTMIDLYYSRAEKWAGRRVLMCWGWLSPYAKHWIYEVTCDTWGPFTVKKQKQSFTSTEFMVIGELHVPGEYRYGHESPRAAKIFMETVNNK